MVRCSPSRSPPVRALVVRTGVGEGAADEAAGAETTAGVGLAAGGGDEAKPSAPMLAPIATTAVTKLIEMADAAATAVFRCTDAPSCRGRSLRGRQFLSRCNSLNTTAVKVRGRGP